jgi:hypothetical protein
MLVLLWGGPGAGEVVDQDIDAATPHAVVELSGYTGGSYLTTVSGPRELWPP